MFKFVPNKSYYPKIFFLDTCSGLSPIYVHLSQNVILKINEFSVPDKVFPIRIELNKYFSCYVNKNPVTICNANCLYCNCFALFINSISGWFCFPYAWQNCYCLISSLIGTNFFPGIFFLGFIITYHHPNIPNPLWPLWFVSSASTISYNNLKYKLINLFLSLSRTLLT